jgi:glycosyltransferase involved in cell wall biosynthesis
MPVFNGEKYLEGSLHSILAQTYSDFELIISDNASTDRTQEICQTYATLDRRIRYFRNKDNLGAAKNFNRTFQLSSGEYFKWAAHDDVIAPDLLLKCVEVLDHDPSVVLCHSRVTIIDEHGVVLGNFDIKLDKVGSVKPQDRFGNLIITDCWCFEVFGLIRASALKRTSLIAGYIASDRILRAELGLLGRFHEIPKYLFFLRDHPERSVRALPAHHLRAGWFDPANVGRIVFPHWRIFLEYFKCVRRVSINSRQMACCYLHLVRWLATNLNWARMLSDLIIAIKPNSWGLFFRLSKTEKSLDVSR